MTQQTQTTGSNATSGGHDQGDNQRTIGEQDREQTQNSHTSTRPADHADGGTDKNPAYSEKRNQSRFTSENDYPNGNTERYNDRARNDKSARENILSAKEPSSDKQTRPRDQSSSDQGARHFTDEKGYQAKTAQDDDINDQVTNAVNPKSP